VGHSGQTTKVSFTTSTTWINHSESQCIYM
jgi:hypothetical protein